MNQNIDIEAWGRQGEAMWTAIHKQKLWVIWWQNPWRRFAVIGGIFLTFTIVLIFFQISLIAGVMSAILAIPFVYTAVKYYRIGAKTGGLYSFFSEHGFGMGCGADRLCIPYSSIILPEIARLSTINDNFLELPVIDGRQGIVIERKYGDDTPWDGTPYTRGFFSVYLDNNQVCVRAYPNAMLVQLFSAIFPLAIYLSKREPTADPSA